MLKSAKAFSLFLLSFTFLFSLPGNSLKPGNPPKFYWYSDYTIRHMVGVSRIYFKAWKVSDNEFENKWKEYQKWFKRENKIRIEEYKKSSGRARIRAARELFKFAVRAKEKGEEILNRWALKGDWVGESSSESRISPFDYMFHRFIFSFKTIPGSSCKLKGRVSGKVKKGHFFLITSPSMEGSTVPFITAESTLMEGKVTGEYSLSERSIDVVLKVKEFFKGAVRDNAFFPYFAIKFVRTAQVKGDYHFFAELKGELPEPYDLLDEYFLLYFNTFSSFFEKEIARTKSLKRKAALAREVFKKYLIDALAIVQRHRLKQQTIDAARLWPKRPESSFDYWFNKYFTFTEKWYLSRIDRSISIEERAGWAERRFGFSIEAVAEASQTLVSSQLIDALGLKFSFPDSYPDRTFRLFFKLNDERFLKKANQLSGQQKLQILLKRFIPNSINMFSFAQIGVLSSQLIGQLGLIYPEENSYADRTYRDYFRESYAFYSNRMEKLPPYSQAFTQALSEFISWAEMQVNYASIGILSQAIVGRYNLYPGGLPEEVRRQYGVKK